MFLIMVMVIIRMTVIRERQIIEPKDETDMYTYIFIQIFRQIELTKINNQPTT
jgi:hypothetical protein